MKWLDHRHKCKYFVVDIDRKVRTMLIHMHIRAHMWAIYDDERRWEISIARSAHSTIYMHVADKSAALVLL